jgi:hypothetical protein
LLISIRVHFYRFGSFACLILVDEHKPASATDWEKRKAVIRAFVAMLHPIPYVSNAIKTEGNVVITKKKQQQQQV